MEMETRMKPSEQSFFFGVCLDDVRDMFTQNKRETFSFVLCCLETKQPNVKLSDVSFVYMCMTVLKMSLYMSQTNVKPPDVRNQTKRWDDLDGNTCLCSQFGNQTFFLKWPQ